MNSDGWDWRRLHCGGGTWSDAWVMGMYFSLVQFVSSIYSWSICHDNYDCSEWHTLDSVSNLGQDIEIIFLLPNSLSTLSLLIIQEVTWAWRRKMVCKIILGGGIRKKRNKKKFPIPIQDSLLPNSIFPATRHSKTITWKGVLSRKLIERQGGSNNS